MIHRIRIKNFKSIDKLQVDLGRVNVVIGANGSGKSNLLEAIAFGVAAENGSLSNEYLGGRGVRMTDGNFMRSAFKASKGADPIEISLKGDDIDLHSSMQYMEEKGYGSWEGSWEIALEEIPDSEKNIWNAFQKLSWNLKRDLNSLFFNQVVEKALRPSKGKKGSSQFLDNADIRLIENREFIPVLSRIFNRRIGSPNSLHIDFITYSPENNKIRNFDTEAQVIPIGVYGEGLFKLLSTMTSEELAEIREHLHFVDWFEDIQVPSKEELAPFQKTIRIKDRFIDDNLKYFDQRSANEGFLFLLFYLTVIVSDLTPKFFAIDNIDNALNPKLCRNLVRVMVKLAKKYDKQIILTTHNPAVLDGINLDDPEQKILVTYRNAEGATRIDYVKKGTPVEGVESLKLSEQFLRGYLGGLNQGGF